MLWIGILALTLVGAIAHSALGKGQKTRRRVVELFLVWLLVGYYGVGMILAAVIQLANPEALARLKGWPVSIPMQTLYAFALLGLAVSAILAVRYRGTYLLAPSISGSLLLLGGAYVHGSEILESGQFVLLKDGPDLLLDFIVPVTVLALATTNQRPSTADPSGVSVLPPAAG